MDLFATRLKSLRKEKGKTQQNIADLLNVRRSTCGEYERGKIIPPVDKIKVLADYFNVSVDYIMGNTNIKTHEERNEKNPYNVSKQLNELLEYLYDNQSALTVDGKLINDESRELLISSLENSLKMAKIINNRK